MENTFEVNARRVYIKRETGANGENRCLCGDYVGLKTKKGMGLVNKFRNAYKQNVFDAYADPSIEKIYAEREIFSNIKEFDARQYRITSANTFTFCAAYLIDAVDAETGEFKTFLIYETAQNRYVIDLYDL